jgi:hypothetical protein
MGRDAAGKCPKCEKRFNIDNLSTYHAIEIVGGVGIVCSRCIETVEVNGRGARGSTMPQDAREVVGYQERE